MWLTRPCSCTLIKNGNQGTRYNDRVNPYRIKLMTLKFQILFQHFTRVFDERNLSFFFFTVILNFCSMNNSLINTTYMILASLDTSLLGAAVCKNNVFID